MVSWWMVLLMASLCTSLPRQVKRSHKVLYNAAAIVVTAKVKVCCIQFQHASSCWRRLGCQGTHVLGMLHNSHPVVTLDNTPPAADTPTLLYLCFQLGASFAQCFHLTTRPRDKVRVAANDSTHAQLLALNTNLCKSCSILGLQHFLLLCNKRTNVFY